jgi:hypothetical protein
MDKSLKGNSVTTILKYDKKKKVAFDVHAIDITNGVFIVFMAHCSKMLRIPCY